MPQSHFGCFSENTPSIAGNQTMILRSFSPDASATPNELPHLPPNGIFYTMTVVDLVSSATKCIYCVDLAVSVCGVLSIL